MENKDVLVVVLTRIHMTGLGVVRSLGEEGYTVDVVASTKTKGDSYFLSLSRYIRNYEEVISGKLDKDEDARLVEKLMEYEGAPFEKIVLFPTDDYSASFIDTYRDTLEKVFLMPYMKDGESGTLIARMDKTYQSGIAGEAGLLVPDEWVIDLRNDIVIPEDIKYPVFVKPLQSISGYKTEMKRCDNQEELMAKLTRMQELFRDREVLCQEFLDIEKEYDLSGVCIDQKIIIPAVIEKTHVAQFERGVTMAGRVVDKDVLKDIMPEIEEMMKKFRYVGMFDMEFNVCGGRILFNEVNLRTGGPHFSYFLSGTNLPDVVVKVLTGREYDKDDETVDVLGKSFIYEKIAWEDYYHGYMSRKELKKTIDAADFTLLGYDRDPKPGNYYIKKIMKYTFKHKIKRKLGMK